MVRITDEITGRTETVEESSFAATVEHWFPGCPQDVISVFDQIQASVVSHRIIRMARQLGLVVDYL
jgi:hypothetical protein